MAKRKQIISIDFSMFEEYAEKIERLNLDLEEIFGEAMEKAARTVQQDTLAALQNEHLPAKGKYSTGTTKLQVISPESVRTKWDGPYGEVELGFDKTKPGAGGYLITGTPKMQPDYALEKIYGQKRYERDLIAQINRDLQEMIDRRMRVR